MIDSPYPWSRRRRPALAVLAGLLAACIALFASRLFKRVEVEGPSMLPALAPGERLLVWRTPVLEEGDIVALTDPARPDRLLVKRVVSLQDRYVEVEGDNAGASRDSRHFGPVARSAVLGRAIYRYHPASAAGRL